MEEKEIKERHEHRRDGIATCLLCSSMVRRRILSPILTPCHLQKVRKLAWAHEGRKVVPVLHLGRIAELTLDAGVAGEPALRA